MKKRIWLPSYTTLWASSVELSFLYLPLVNQISRRQQRPYLNLPS